MASSVSVVAHDRVEPSRRLDWPGPVEDANVDLTILVRTCR